VLRHAGLRCGCWLVEGCRVESAWRTVELSGFPTLGKNRGNRGTCVGRSGITTVSECYPAPMPSRYCRECHIAVPAAEFRAHRDRHWSAKSARPGSTSEWREKRARIIERDGGRCTRCGTTADLEVHHIDGDWKNNREENLETRCLDCNPRGRPTHKSGTLVTS
jgi:hypothetical protein